MALFFFLISLTIQAHVIQDEVSTVRKDHYTFKQVCSKLVSHESPLIEALSGTELDCMGKKVAVADFCDKEMVKDPYFIRSYVDQENKQVICHSGKKVLFKYLCVKKSDSEICGESANQSCMKLKVKLAKRLDLVHSSLIKNSKGIKQLNCFYESLPIAERF